MAAGGMEANPFQAALALMQAQLGQVDDARRSFEALAANGFDVPRDLTWTCTLSFLAEACGLLGDTSRAATLFDLLEPHGGHLVVTGWGDVSNGAIDRYLGILAACCRRWAVAEDRYRSAIALEAGIGAAPHLARTRCWYGRMLVERGDPGDREEALVQLDAAAAAESLGMARVMAEARGLAAVASS